MQNSVLFGILLSILSRPHTAPELAKKYELSIRSVYRYVDTLEAAGVPLLRRAGNSGGYSLDSAHFIDKTYFTAEEYRYLSDLLANADFGGKTASEVLTKFRALARMQSTDNGYRIAPANLVIDADSWTDTGGKTKQLNAAIEARRVIRITYVDGDLSRTERAIEPHTLVFKQSAWYLYAYCRLRSDWRLFALSRIADSMGTDETFARRAYDLDRVPWRTLSNDALVPIELRFDASVAHLVADWLGADAIVPETSTALNKMDGADAIIPETLCASNRINGGADIPFDTPKTSTALVKMNGADATVKLSPCAAQSADAPLSVDRLSARAKLPLNHATVTKLLSFGDALEVVFPAELRARIAATLARAAKKYHKA